MGVYAPHIGNVAPSVCENAHKRQSTYESVPVLYMYVKDRGRVPEREEPIAREFSPPTGSTPLLPYPPLLEQTGLYWTKAGLSGYRDRHRQRLQDIPELSG